MNYRGSYRHLLKNGKAALLAAIEIYNKPRFDYREACCVILLLNAWELILKALLSKNGRSKYAWKYRYPGEEDEPSRQEVERALDIARRLYEAVLARLPEEVRP